LPRRGDIVERAAFVEERRLRRVEIFRLRILLERAAAERNHAPAQIGDREHHAVAEAVERHRDVVAGDQEAGLDHVLDRDIVRAEMLLERETLAWRVAEAKLELRCRIEPTVGEIAARLGAVARRERVLEEFRRKLHYVLRRASRASSSCETLGSGTPAICARRSTASGKLTPSDSITKSKMLPFLPEEKSKQAFFWSFTKKDGVFSLLNGDRPLN